MSGDDHFIRPDNDELALPLERDWVQFLRDAEQRTLTQAANINPCADADDAVKNALLVRAAEWRACANVMDFLMNTYLSGG